MSAEEDSKDFTWETNPIYGALLNGAASDPPSYHDVKRLFADPSAHFIFFVDGSTKLKKELISQMTRKNITPGRLSVHLMHEGKEFIHQFDDTQYVLIINQSSHEDSYLQTIDDRDGDADPAAYKKTMKSEELKNFEDAELKHTGTVSGAASTTPDNAIPGGPTSPPKDDLPNILSSVAVQDRQKRLSKILNSGEVSGYMDSSNKVLNIDQGDATIESESVDLKDTSARFPDIGTVGGSSTWDVSRPFNVLRHAYEPCGYLSRAKKMVIPTYFPSETGPDGLVMLSDRKSTRFIHATDIAPRGVDPNATVHGTRIQPALTTVEFVYEGVSVPVPLYHGLRTQTTVESLERNYGVVDSFSTNNPLKHRSWSKICAPCRFTPNLSYCVPLDFVHPQIDGSERLIAYMPKAFGYEALNYGLANNWTDAMKISVALHKERFQYQTATAMAMGQDLSDFDRDVNLSKEMAIRDIMQHIESAGKKGGSLEASTAPVIEFKQKNGSPDTTKPIVSLTAYVLEDPFETMRLESEKLYLDRFYTNIRPYSVKYKELMSKHGFTAHVPLADSQPTCRYYDDPPLYFNNAALPMNIHDGSAATDSLEASELSNILAGEASLLQSKLTKSVDPNPSVFSLVWTPFKETPSWGSTLKNWFHGGYGTMGDPLKRYGIGWRDMGVVQLMNVVYEYAINDRLPELLITPDGKFRRAHSIVAGPDHNNCGLTHILSRLTERLSNPLTAEGEAKQVEEAKTPGRRSIFPMRGWEETRVLVEAWFSSVKTAFTFEPFKLDRVPTLVLNSKGEIASSKKIRLPQCMTRNYTPQTFSGRADLREVGKIYSGYDRTSYDLIAAVISSTAQLATKGSLRNFNPQSQSFSPAWTEWSYMIQTWRRQVEAYVRSHPVSPIRDGMKLTSSQYGYGTMESKNQVHTMSILPSVTGCLSALLAPSKLVRLEMIPESARGMRTVLYDLHPLPSPDPPIFWEAGPNPPRTASDASSANLPSLVSAPWYGRSLLYGIISSGLNLGIATNFYTTTEMDVPHEFNSCVAMAIDATISCLDELCPILKVDSDDRKSAVSLITRLITRVDTTANPAQITMSNMLRIINSVIWYPNSCKATDAFQCTASLIELSLSVFGEGRTHELLNVSDDKTDVTIFDRPATTKLLPYVPKDDSKDLLRQALFEHKQTGANELVLNNNMINGKVRGSSSFYAGDGHFQGSYVTVNNRFMSRERSDPYVPTMAQLVAWRSALFQFPETSVHHKYTNTSMEKTLTMLSLYQGEETDVSKLLISLFCYMRSATFSKLDVPVEYLINSIALELPKIIVNHKFTGVSTSTKWGRSVLTTIPPTSPIAIEDTLSVYGRFDNDTAEIYGGVMDCTHAIHHPTSRKMTASINAEPIKYPHYTLSSTAPITGITKQSTYEDARDYMIRSLQLNVTMDGQGRTLAPIEKDLIPEKPFPLTSYRRIQRTDVWEHNN